MHSLQLLLTLCPCHIVVLILEFARLADSQRFSVVSCFALSLESKSLGYDMIKFHVAILTHCLLVSVEMSLCA